MKKAVDLHRLGVRIKCLERPLATGEEGFDVFHFFDDVRGENLAPFFGDVKVVFDADSDAEFFKI